MVTKVTIITILIVSLVTLIAIPFVTPSYGAAVAAGGGSSTIQIGKFDVLYEIRGGNISTIGINEKETSIDIVVEGFENPPVEEGYDPYYLELWLPHDLIDTKSGGTFIILLDGELVSSGQGFQSDNPRWVGIHYEKGFHKIQIIGDILFTSTLPSAPITVSTDKSVYRDGDTVHVSGTVSNLLEGFSITLSAIRPDGKVVTVQQFDVSNDRTFETELTAGGSLWDTNGIYTIKVLYGTVASTAQTTIEFKKKTGQDLVPPLLLVPEDILVGATDNQGVRVKYSVKSIDDVDGVLEPFCNPPSGYLFPIGDNEVTCQSFDSSGNNIKKSFTITVQNPATFVIPDWVKDVAGFWCNDEIDDSSFIEAIQYLIENGVILVPLSESGSGTTQIVPSWIKNNACWWSQGLISDDDFASGLEYLIQHGIIKV